MPRVDWSEKNMKHIFIFFPLVGAFIGLLWHFCYNLFKFLDMGINLSCILLMLISIVVSGGIHFDGVIDTNDAIFSYGDKEKKLAILKDSHVGAFGVIACAVYLLLIFAFTSQLYETDFAHTSLILPFSFVLSRSIGGICLLSIKSAKKSGLGASFANASKRKTSLVFLYMYCIASFTIITLINLIVGLLSFLIIALFLTIFIPFIKKEFGGMTGDLTGYIIMIVELICVAVLALTPLIIA